MAKRSLGRPQGHSDHRRLGMSKSRTGLLFRRAYPLLYAG